ncbi:ABC transporter permease [Ohtaekwangia koreensis]|nr:ABC transporter permease [Ohtaekwangia koreensis]
MLKNYFKIALRNLLRNSVYSVINISGLSIGIACTILILLWVYDEVTYDRFQPKYDNLYQAWIKSHFDGTISSWTSGPQPLAEGIKNADTHVRNTVLVDWGGEHLLRVGDNRIVKQGHFVGKAFLEMFQFELIKGDAATVLDDPTSIVLTESAAKALFGDQDPINQLVNVSNFADLKVTGILKDIPRNSSFEFECLIPWDHNKKYAEWIKETENTWGEYSFQTFVELAPGTPSENVDKSISDILTKNGEDEMKREVFLYPMSRWRLHSSFKNGIEEGGLIDYVTGFTAIAAFIMIIACINFMNLSTARSERRAREVGIRKSVGSRRKEIVAQFLGESVLLSMFALLLAIVLVEIALPFYNTLVQKKLTLDFTSPLFWILSVSLVLFTGLLSGSYPAFYLSSFQPAAVLKGKITVGKTGVTPRKILVTLQFGFSIILISSTLIIQQQISHIKDRELGYQQNKLMMVDCTADLEKNYKAVKNELLNGNIATSVTKSQSPVTAIFSNNFVGWPGKPEDLKVLFTTLRVDYDYNKTMGTKITEGRDFSEEHKSDTAAVILNQAAIEVMGLKDPIGTQLDIWGDKFEVIGITENVLMGSLFQEVKPSFTVLRTESANFITIRLPDSKTIPESVKEVEKVTTKYNPAYPFDYTFADTEFAKKFTEINLISDLSNIFAFLAIFITGLGLFGLAAFTAEQRTKEIGIRKVLGATLSGIVVLISKDFSRMVIIAFLIAAPLAWWMMNEFLERYSYRIEVPLWVLLASGAIALLFALVIVSTQALRAGRRNPAQSLRNE